MPGTAAMTDMVFALDAPVLPREHRSLLADAVQAVLPWLADEAAAGLHPLRLQPGDGAVAYMPRRTRLVLRVPQAQAGASLQLAGAELRVGAHRARVGSGRPRALQPWSTLYAHLVASDDADELRFLADTGRRLQALGVRCRAICGRHQALERGTLQGFGLMLDGLDDVAAHAVLDAGVGAHRRLGCGIFVAHRSAAAVGTMDH